MSGYSHGCSFRLLVLRLAICVPVPRSSRAKAKAHCPTSKVLLWPYGHSQEDLRNESSVPSTFGLLRPDEAGYHNLY